LNIVPDGAIRQDALTAQEIPEEIEPSAVPTTESSFGTEEPKAAAKTVKTDKTSVEAEKRKEPKPAVNEKKTPAGAGKKGAGQKTAALRPGNFENRTPASIAEKRTGVLPPGRRLAGSGAFPYIKISGAGIDRKT
jgi:hypothetical protein